MVLVWTACCILHNLIVTDEATDDGLLDQEYLFEDSAVSFSFRMDRPSLSAESLTGLARSMKHVRSDSLHLRLRTDLMEHIWELHGTGHI